MNPAGWRDFRVCTEAQLVPNRLNQNQLQIDNQEIDMSLNKLLSKATFAKAVELGSLRSTALAQEVTPQTASQSLAQRKQHMGEPCC